ncbi:MAG: carboxypeptidase-like regulatory domain-containing protein, partial [Mucilaginibacter sp.]
LADALEGYEHAGADQQKHLLDLSNRLQNRTQKVRRLFAWGAISAAASVILVIGIGIWFFSRNNKPQNQPPQVALAVPVTKKSPDTIRQGKPAKPGTIRSNTPNAIAKTNVVKHTVHRSVVNKAEYDANSFHVPAPSAETSPVLVFKKFKDSTPVNEMAVDGSKASKKDSVAHDVLKNTAPYAANSAANAKTAARKKKVVNPDTILQAHVDGVSVEPSNVTGVVTGRDDGMPITGAIVKITGSGFGAVTDANGRFALRNVPQNATLAVGYIGYKSKKVRVKRGDSLTISLEPASTALAEVVVAKPNNEDNPDKITTPAPVKGWDDFDSYLKENSKSPDGQTGKVKLSFMVNPDGSLANFKVTKSLNATDDQKAIDLIKNGPAWSGGRDNKPHVIKVTVKFD